ncbi:MAG: cytochrome P450 [Dehalococcoidia bacterium]
MNPFSPDVKKCPYPYYDQVRATQPVQWNAEIDAWLVSSYEAAVEVLKDHATYSSTNSVFGGPRLDHPEFPSMINEDEPKHMKLRSLAAKAFTPKYLEHAWEPRIRELTNELLDGVEAKGSFDVIGDLAFPLPVTIIAEIIGVESHRFAQFKVWSDEIARQIGRLENYEGDFDPDELEKPADLGELFVYFSQIVADRRENPRDDMVTRLALAEIDGERLTDWEIVAFLVLMLVAGNETTTNLIGTAARALVEHPELIQQIRERPALMENLLEESLRWDAPIQGFYRRAVADSELAGQQIKAGDALLVLYAAGNWDPKEFACPAGFDIERGRRDHLSFGLGKHYCLGANLARLEAGIALKGIIDRFDRLEMTADYEPQWRDTPFFRGMEELPLAFTMRRVAVTEGEAVAV